MNIIMPYIHLRPDMNVAEEFWMTDSISENNQHKTDINKNPSMHIVKSNMILTLKAPREKCI